MFSNGKVSEQSEALASKLDLLQIQLVSLGESTAPANKNDI